MRFLFTFFISFICFSLTTTLFSQATLPLLRSIWSGTEPTGWTKSGTGTYGTDCTGSNGSSSCALNDSGDYIYVFFNTDPLNLTFNIKSEGLSGAYSFKIQESINGSTWVDLDEFNSGIPTTCSSETYTLTSTTRYVRFYYQTKATGNVRIDEVNITAVPLPIKVKSFDVVKTNSTTKLMLTTSSETNNDFFTIERSIDGAEFDAIGEIKGAGNSSAELKYEFIDENPLLGINYYRIKQTDFDGKYSYTEIKSVRHHVGKITISPLRTNGRLQITSTQDNYDAALYNAAGQEVFRKNTLNGDQTIDIESLEAGIYFVKIVDQTFKIIKY